MKHLTKFLATLLLVATVQFVAFAGGYQINEHGARATGMGGAFAARASDGSAMFFNAAGLGFQKGMNVLVGTTLIFPSTTFTGPTPATTESKMVDQMFYPSNIYGSYAVNDQLVVGLGIYNPYGLGTEWDNEWIGRKLTVKTDLQTFYINPTVAYKINDNLSVGVGVSYVIANAKIKQRAQTYSSLAPPTPSTKDGTVNLEGDGNGISFNLGVIYKPMEKLSLGASYRSLVDIEFTGDATFTDMQALQAYFPGGEGKVSLPMPSSLQVGVAYDVMPELTVEVDIQYVGWSSYDKLDITLPNGPVSPLGILQKSSTADKKWEDAMMIRLGGEYKVNDQLMVRAGYIRDMTPQPVDKMEPMLPDADRNDISVGAGYKINDNLTVDASYLLVMFEDRASTYKPSTSTTFYGTYKSSANLISLNVGYSF
ncbi:MAG: OmpP1/FadL family transporter [Bacteroidota bacterium]